jgi:hypothetical protein
VYKRSGMSAGTAKRSVNAGANAVTRAEREDAKKLGEAIGHELYITRLSIGQTSMRTRPYLLSAVCAALDVATGC